MKRMIQRETISRISGSSREATPAVYGFGPENIPPHFHQVSRIFSIEFRMALHGEYMITNAIHTVWTLLCRGQQLSAFGQPHDLVPVRNDQRIEAQLIAFHEPG